MGPQGRWASATHVLFYGTLLIALAMSGWKASTPRGVFAAELAFSMLLAGWYWRWIVRRPRAIAGSAWLRLGYFIGVAVLWTALLWLDPTFDLLSFSVFVQLLGYLPWRSAIVGTTLGVVLAHVPPAIRSGGVGVNHIVFGGVSVGVLILVLISLRSVAEQSVRRLRLIEELEAARSELAQVARRSGVLEERHRLAGEVHDTIAQALTSVVMLLEAAQSAGSDSNRLRRHLGEALQTARESLREVRQVVWALRPESLESGSIADALMRTATRVSAQSGVDVRAVVTGTPMPLAAELEVTLLRIAQEGLANVRRHARAREAIVTLSYLSDTVTLDVWDDGIGFDPAELPAEPRRQGGLGLVGMRERVRALEGSLTVESAPGQGTTLVVELPIDSARTELEHAHEGVP